MIQNCAKFMLTESEVYFVSGSDGSLYAEEMEIFRDNDFYCIDYTKKEKNNFTIEVMENY